MEPVDCRSCGKAPGEEYPDGSVRCEACERLCQQENLSADDEARMRLAGLL